MKKNRPTQKQYIVIGLGRFGRSVARTLCESGAQVLGLDRNQAVVDNLADVLTQCICVDATDPDALKALNVSDFPTAVVTTATDIKSSCIVVMMLKEMGVKQVIAKAMDELHGAMLKKLGADIVLLPERDMGRHAAYSILTGRLFNTIEMAADFVMIETEPWDEWIGKSLRELNMRSRYEINVVAIRRGSETILPDPNTVFDKDDHVLIVAKSATIAKMNS